ncbi:MAG: hypothetical protein ACK5KN_11555 [Dysgonomonas sp.]|uniref:hypothetical protein n=1 Tax=Dysgonomonas sp. TaxID=1891233 RepID=UPI003A88B245
MINQKKIESLAILHIDKLLHFGIGLLLAQLAYVWIWFVLLPLLIGFVKELYDQFIRKTGFNWLDLYITALGALPVLFVLLLI